MLKCKKENMMTSHFSTLYQESCSLWSDVFFKLWQHHVYPTIVKHVAANNHVIGWGKAKIIYQEPLEDNQVVKRINLNKVQGRFSHEQRRGYLPSRIY